MVLYNYNNYSLPDSSYYNSSLPDGESVVLSSRYSSLSGEFTSVNARLGTTHLSQPLLPTVYVCECVCECEHGCTFMCECVYV